MDATTTSVIIGTVGTVAGTLLGIVCTKGVDAWLKLRADRRIDETREETLEDTNLRFIITRQDAEIVQLRTEIRELYTQHSDCERKHAALLVRVEMLEKKV